MMTMTETSPVLHELATALAKAQAEFKSIPKTADNAFFHSKYADLAAVVSAAQPIAAKHGLSVAQFPTFLDTGEPVLTTYLLHSSGQYMTSTMRLFAAKNDPQGQGSAITYARRFSYMAVLGLVADNEDDDGHAATPRDNGNGAAPKQPPRQRKPKAAKSPADEARDELLALCRENGLSAMEVAQRFADDYRTKITDADALLINGFTAMIRDEIKLDAAAAADMPPVPADDVPGGVDE